MLLHFSTSTVLLALCATYSALGRPLGIAEEQDGQSYSVAFGTAAAPSQIDFWRSSPAALNRRADIVIDPIPEPAPEEVSPGSEESGGGGISSTGGIGAGNGGIKSGSNAAEGADPFDPNAQPESAPQQPAPKPETNPESQPKVTIPDAPPEVGPVRPDMVRVYGDATKITAPGAKYAIPKDRSLLYAGPRKPIWDLADQLSDQFELKYFGGLQRNLQDENEFYAQFDGGDGAAMGDFANIISAVLASRASGNVKVLLPSGGLIGKGVFTDIEWPQLMRSGNVDSVTWVDPKDFNHQQVIWTRQQGSIDFPINTPPTKMAGH